MTRLHSLGAPACTTRRLRHGLVCIGTVLSPGRGTHTAFACGRGLEVAESVRIDPSRVMMFHLDRIPTE